MTTNCRRIFPIPIGVDPATPDEWSLECSVHGEVGRVQGVSFAFDEVRELWAEHLAEHLQQEVPVDHGRHRAPVRRNLAHYARATWTLWLPWLVGVTLVVVLGAGWNGLAWANVGVIVLNLPRFVLLHWRVRQQIRRDRAALQARQDRLKNLLAKDS